MSFNWTLFINLAEHLIEDHNPQMDDAWIRTSVSRCYYGLYGLASDFIKSEGIVLPSKDTHKFVREQYKNSSNKKLNKIGNGLGNLLLERKKADYYKSISITHTQSKLLFLLTKQMIELLKEIKRANLHFNPSS